MSEDADRLPSGPSPESPTRLPERGPRSSLPEGGDYRDDLRSRRWAAAPLRNPEVEKTDPRIAVAAIILLCVITLLILVAGYGSGFWSLPS